MTILVFSSCSHEQDGQEKNLGKFEIPTITQSQKMDSMIYFKPDSLTSTYTKFISKYKFTNLITNIEYKDTSIRKDYIYGYSRLLHNDSLTTDGFQLKSDYKTTIILNEEWDKQGHAFFPVFLINETSETKIFIGKDNHVFAIQEALDSNRIWRPIEGRSPDFCGNGYWGLKIHPKEFVLFIMPKYKGNVETLLRVRLKVGDNIYITQPYKGWINQNQFYLKRDGMYAHRIKEDPFGSIMTWFYGSLPKECDRHTNDYAVWSRLIPK